MGLAGLFLLAWIFPEYVIGAFMDIIPHMVSADSDGNIVDDPEILMCCRKGSQWTLPKMEELIPLPDESELFLLPGRNAVGLDRKSGELVRDEGFAVAAFAAPAYTLSAHPVYDTKPGAAILPLFAYGAVGYAKGRFWICAKKVDDDPRQQFVGIRKKQLTRLGRELLQKYPQNRLVKHIINNCAMRYNCPAARNFVLGRHEAPLPSSQTCNARCIGCISAKTADSPLLSTPQCRLGFVPDAHEIAEVMRIHALRETHKPIFSFGQGCEGDPLANPDLLAESISIFRKSQKNDGRYFGTINCNTNASRPEAVKLLTQVGLTSMRVSLNSARKEFYEAYYRPVNYSLADVASSIREAREGGVFVSLNLLFFPGISDTEQELDALSHFVGENGVSMIQWRNLNIDPEWYMKLMEDTSAPLVPEGGMGLAMFMKRLKKACPWLEYGYFNPYLGDRAEIKAPMPH